MGKFREKARHPPHLSLDPPLSQNPKSSLELNRARAGEELGGERLTGDAATVGKRLGCVGVDWEATR